MKSSEIDYKEMKMSEINMNSCFDGFNANISGKKVRVKQKGRAYLVQVNAVRTIVSDIKSLKSFIKSGWELML